MSNFSPFVRIGLRIIGGILIGRGYIEEKDIWIFSDQEIIGAATILVSEAWYLAAKKFGWSK